MSVRQPIVQISLTIAITNKRKEILIMNEIKENAAWQLMVFLKVDFVEFWV